MKSTSIICTGPNAAVGADLELSRAPYPLMLANLHCGTGRHVEVYGLALFSSFGSRLFWLSMNLQLTTCAKMPDTQSAQPAPS